MWSVSYRIITIVFYWLNKNIYFCLVNKILKGLLLFESFDPPIIIIWSLKMKFLASSLIFWIMFWNTWQLCHRDDVDEFTHQKRRIFLPQLPLYFTDIILTQSKTSYIRLIVYQTIKGLLYVFCLTKDFFANEK